MCIRGWNYGGREAGRALPEGIATGAQHPGPGRPLPPASWGPEILAGGSGQSGPDVGWREWVDLGKTPPPQESGRCGDGGGGGQARWEPQVAGLVQGTFCA